MTLRTGYIVSPLSDSVWFLGLPFLAFAFALGCQEWLSAVAITSVAVLITGPHHFVTLVRVFGFAEDRKRFWDRLIIGLVVISAITSIGYVYAPLTLVLLSTMWNHQHAMMQIHGFTRIYDFKANAGAKNTGWWDFWLNIVLYSNLFLTLPLFMNFWLRELYRFQLTISAETVQMIHRVSWLLTTVFVACYIAHVIRSVAGGNQLNPLKYVFLVSSYGIFYATGYAADSALVFSIAAQLMHGIQYIVIVHWYMKRKIDDGTETGLLSRLLKRGNVLALVGLCAIYVVTIQLVGSRSFDQLAFGLIDVGPETYQPIPEHSIGAFTTYEGASLLGTILIGIPGLLHLYYDSFIWKVRDQKIRKGL